MRTLIFILAVAFSLNSCHGQEKSEANQDMDALSKTEQNKQEPKGSWKVHREVDEHGNLIRYDSIYTYSYGNVNGEQLAPEDVDSAIAEFRKYMEARIPEGFFGNDFVTPFSMDSLRNSFFENGVFQNNWEHFFPDMQQQLRRMDSLHQQFFQQRQPGLFPLEKEWDEKDNRM
ncbi:MAG TPA: hypothetical protein VKX40_03640 [Aequorivita sp.]|nr:hypothetical protein [Aequorivita sp.]